MTAFIFDCETDGLLDDLTVVHSLVLKDADHGFGYTCHDQGAALYCGNDVYKPETIEQGLRRLMEADCVIGHNILKYDIPAITKVYPWFHIDESKVIDTLLISQLIWTNLKDQDFRFRKRTPQYPGVLIGRHSLEAWGWRVGMHKGDYKKEMEEQGIDPWAEWNPSMQEYCENDVEVTYRLWKLILKKNYSQEAIQLEHDFAHIIQKQEQHGFPFDVKCAEEIYAELVQWRMDLEELLQAVFRPWLAQSGKKVHPKRTQRRFVKNKYGSHMRGGERGYYEYVTQACPYHKIKLVAFNPGSRAHIAGRLKFLYGWEPTEFTASGEPKVDDEVIGSLPYAEAKPLTEYLTIQKRIGQLAEGDNACLKLVKSDGRIHGEVVTNGAVTGRCTHRRPNVAQTPAVGVPLGYEFRSLYYAPPGWKLVGADASGLELRCLGHFMARYDSGAYIKILLEGDIHSANQTAAGLPTRANAKTFIYAFLYGAGDEKIGSIVGKGAKEGKRLKARFLKQTPALKRLREDVIEKVKTKGYLKGLDGRILHIRSSHSALNTLFQSAGALIMKKATVIFIQKLTARGYVFGKDYALVAHVHDEMQTLAREEIANEVGQLAVESIRESGEYFKFRCPLDGDAKVGGSWAETH